MSEARAHSSPSNRQSACIFCRIIAGEVTARVIYETSDVICFLPMQVEVYGHTLIVPKRHFQDIYDISSEALAAVGEVGRELALAYKEKIGATGVNFLHASGRDAEQSVFHYHTHLLPRMPGDGLSTWPCLPDLAADVHEMHARLRFE